MNVVTGSNTADTATNLPHECKCTHHHKESVYQSIIEELKEQVQREKTAKEWAQKEYCRVQTMLEKTDAELENKKGVIANLDKTLQRYERENKALRQLVELWI